MLGSVGGHTPETNLCTKPGLWDWDILGTTLGYVDGFIVGAYDEIEIG